MISFPVIQSKLGLDSGIGQGKILILKAVKPLAGGMWQVSYSGKLLVIKSEIVLKPGQMLRTRAERMGEGWVLKLLDGEANSNTSATRVLQRSGLPTDNLSRILLQAFQSRGLRIDSGMLSRARSALKTLKRRDNTTAGVITSIVEKGLTPDPYFVESIMGFLDGSGPKGRHHRDSENQPDGEDQEDVREQVRNQLSASQKNTDILHLFNHISGGSDHWVLLPYSVKKGQKTAKGNVRLHIDKTRGIKRMVLDVESMGGKATFSLNWPQNGPVNVSVRSDDPSTSRSLIKSQGKEKLRNLNLINDDNKNEENLDRFRQVTVPRLRGIDEIV